MKALDFKEKVLRSKLSNNKEVFFDDLIEKIETEYGLENISNLDIRIYNYNSNDVERSNKLTRIKYSDCLFYGDINFNEDYITYDLFLDVNNYFNFMDFLIPLFKLYGFSVIENNHHYLSSSYTITYD